MSNANRSFSRTSPKVHIADRKWLWNGDDETDHERWYSPQWETPRSRCSHCHPSLKHRAETEWENEIHRSMLTEGFEYLYTELFGFAFRVKFLQTTSKQRVCQLHLTRRGHSSFHRTLYTSKNFFLSNFPFGQSLVDRKTTMFDHPLKPCSSPSSLAIPEKSLMPILNLLSWIGGIFRKSVNIFIWQVIRILLMLARLLSHGQYAMKFHSLNNTSTKE